MSTRISMTDKLSSLKLAGLNVSYANPRDGHECGYVSSFRVSNTPMSDDDRPYVELSSIAAGDDRDDQTTTCQRSNYRRLKADYPGLFVDVSYSNVDALGVFVRDLTEDTLNLIVGLAVDYPIYDESDLSELEFEEIGEAFDQYLWWDARDSLTEETTDLAAEFTDGEIREAFYDALAAGDYYPEHNGLEVVWDDSEVTALLTAAIESLARKLNVSGQSESLPSL